MSIVENLSSSARADVASKGLVRMPDTFVILFMVVLAAFALTYVVVPGKFSVETVHYTAAGVEKTREVLVAGSYQALRDADGEPLRQGARLFGADGERGFLNFVFDGMTSGSRHGAAIGVMVFILVIGGAFGIILRTGAVEAGILKLIDKTRGREILFLPVMAVLFSLGGAVFGMGEEAIAFALIIVPLVIALGYDALTGVMITYIATQVGFGTSWMNPFSVAIAQGIANVPVLSGAPFRIALWAVFTLALVLFTLWHAQRVKRHPQLSRSYASDAYFREDLSNKSVAVEFSLGHWLVIATLFAGVAWVVWGVVAKGYYIPEIATQFFSTGLAIGVIAIVFRINNMSVNDMAAAFKEGAAGLLPAAFIVGMAQGVVIILGGADPTHYSVLNTLLHHSAEAIAGFSQTASALMMFLFQSVFNVFVTSGSGQAALTMPLMAPLSDLVGVSRQVAVLAFQLGDGWTHLIVPTSAPLMGTLGVARIDYLSWVKFVFKFYLVLMGLSCLAIVIAVAMPLQ